MSKAAANLAALSNMGGNIAQVEDAATALDRITPDRSAAPVDDEADFGTPEAIATAVAASFILGPIGGLLMGGAQGWLKKQADQSILDQIATEQNVLTESAAVYDDVLQGFKDSATSEEDMAQVAALEAQRTAAVKMMTSGDVNMRDQGMEAFAKFEAGAQGYATLQETQKIAGEAEDARLKTELDDRQYGRFTKMRDSFSAESQTFQDTMQSTSQALIALESGSAADIWATSILLNKSLDPESVVRSEEAAAVQSQGTRLEKWTQLADKELASGEGMSADTKRIYRDLVRDIQSNVTGFQLAREARFMDQAIDAELPQKYMDNFRLASTLPGIENFSIPDDTAENAPVTTAVDKIIETVSRLPESTQGNILDDMRLGVTDSLEELVDWYSGSGRDARDAQRGNLPTN